MSRPRVRSTVQRRGRTAKPPDGGIAADDVHVDAESRGMLDEVLAVAAVDPGPADGGMLGGHLLDQGLSGGGVLHARGRDQHSQEQADGVDDDAPLAAHDFLARVNALAGCGTVGGGPDALRVDDACTGLGLAAFLPADLAAQETVEPGLGRESGPARTELPSPELGRHGPGWSEPGCLDRADRARTRLVRVRAGMEPDWAGPGALRHPAQRPPPTRSPRPPRSISSG